QPPPTIVKPYRAKILLIFKATLFFMGIFMCGGFCAVRFALQAIRRKIFGLWLRRLGRMRPAFYLLVCFGKEC
ncbi:MAG: hypothetical protein Q3966_00615, partial [Neisseria sp.]|nr:hypothetical protein [Neisseria sp.]